MDEAEEFLLAQEEVPHKEDLNVVYQFELDVYNYIGCDKHVAGIKQNVQDKMKEYEKRYNELWQNTQ